MMCFREAIEDMLAGKGKPGASLSSLTSINRQLEGVQAQRRALLPGDVVGRRALDRQNEDLLNQQQQPLQDVSAGQTQLAGYIEGLKKSKAQLAELAQQGGITQEDYKKDSEGLDKRLQRAIALQDQLNGKIAQLPDIVGRVTRAFAEVTAQLEAANIQIDRLAAAGRKSAAISIINGASAGQADYARSLNDEATLTRKMSVTNQAADMIQNTIQTPEIMKALDSVGIKSIDQINPTSLKARIAGMEDGTQKDLLTTAADQKQQIDSLRTEAANLDAQLSESQAATVQRLRDVARSIGDYYRGLEASFNQLQIETKALGLQTQTQTAQNKLRKALIGAQESFTNDFVESLMGLIEALNKPLQDAIGSQQQILQAQQQYIQQIQQGYQLGQQLPTLEQVAPGQGEALQQGINDRLKNGAPSMTPQINGASNGQGAIGNSATGASSTAILQQLQGYQSANVQQSTVSGQFGLQGAQQIAGQIYKQTVANINQQLANSQRSSRTDAAIGLSQANYQLFQARRRMSDTGRGFERSTEDLASRGQTATPERELQTSLRGLAREFDDSMRSMGDFKRGLEQTIDQQVQVRQRIVEDNSIPAAYKQQLLAGIDQTIGEARTQLSGLNQKIGEYGEAYKQATDYQRREFQRQDKERRFQTEQKIGGFDNQLDSQLAQAAKYGGNGAQAREIERGAKQREIGMSYQSGLRDIQELLRTGQITNGEFSKMREQLGEINSASLSNLDQEFKKLEKDRIFEVSQRLAGLKRQLNEQLAQSARNSGNGEQARAIEFSTQSDEIKNNYQSGLREAENLLQAGQLSAKEFEQVKQRLQEINQVSLANLKQQFEQVEADRLFSVDQKSAGFSSQQMQARSAAARLGGDGTGAIALENQAKIADQGNSYRQQEKELRDMLRAGTLTRQEFARLKAQLDDLNATSLSNIANEARKVEADRLFSAGQKSSGFAGQLIQQQATAAQYAGDPNAANQLNLRGAILGQQASYSSQLKELEDLRNSGQLTKSEFAQMSEQLANVNAVSLANIQEQFKKLADDRIFAAQQKLSQLKTQLTEIRANLARLSGDAEGAINLDYSAKVSSQKSNYKQQIKDLENMRSSGQLTNAEFSKMESKVRAVNRAMLRQLAIEAQRAKETRLFNARQKQAGLDAELMQAQATAAKYAGKGGSAIALERSAKLLSAQTSNRQQMKDLDDAFKSGQLTRQEFGRLKNTLTELNGISLSNLSKELQKVDAERVYRFEQKRDSLTGSLLQQQEQAAKSGGDVRGAFGLQERSSVLGQRTSYKEQLKELADLRDSGELTSGEFAQLRSNLESLNNVSLKNIRKEVEESKIDRLFNASQRESGLNSDLLQAQARAASLGGDENKNRFLDTSAKVNDINSGFQSQIKELRDLYQQGQLTSDEFARMTEKVKGLNKLNLANLRTELQKTTVEGIVGILGSDSKAFDKAEIGTKFKQIKKRYSMLSDAGYFSDQQKSWFDSAFSSAKSLVSSNASEKTILKQAQANKDNPFFAQFMEAIGRGDIASMVKLPTTEGMNAALGMIPGQSSAVATSGDQSVDLGNINSTIETFSGNVATKMDEIKTALAAALNAPRNLYVTSANPNADAAKLWQDLAKDGARAAGM